MFRRFLFIVSLKGAFRALFLISRHFCNSGSKSCRNRTTQALFGDPRQLDTGRGGDPVIHRQDLFDLVTVARRLEACEGEASRRLAVAAASLFPDSDASWARVGGGQAIFTGNTLPINRATGMGMEGPLSRGDWEAFESFFITRGFPPELDVCPMADPSLFRLIASGG